MGSYSVCYRFYKWKAIFFSTGWGAFLLPSPGFYEKMGTKAALPNASLKGAPCGALAFDNDNQQGSKEGSFSGPCHGYEPVGGNTNVWGSAVRLCEGLPIDFSIVPET